MRVTGRNLVQSIGSGGRHVRPSPLPPREPPLGVDATRRSARARAGAGLGRSSCRRDGPVARLVHLRVRPQGGGGLVADRGHAGDARRPARVRGEERRAGPPGRRRRGGLQLPRRAHLRARAARGPEGPAALDAPPERDAPTADARRARRREAARAKSAAARTGLAARRPGNAAYVPPPPNALGEVLGDFEKYLHADDALPPLVRAGLLHVQFETIHPYLDGNGRIGRLLVTLLLEHWKLLTKPLLYLSLFFKRHREEYYRRLDAVRDRRRLGGVARLLPRRRRDHRRRGGRFRARAVRARGRGSRARARARRMSVDRAATARAAPGPSGGHNPRHREAAGDDKANGGQGRSAPGAPRRLVETSGKRRDRTFAYKRYLERLRIGTELEES